MAKPQHTSTEAIYQILCEWFTAQSDKNAHQRPARRQPYVALAIDHYMDEDGNATPTDAILDGVFNLNELAQTLRVAFTNGRL